jgi:iron complex transport system ATP-binding protein
MITLRELCVDQRVKDANLQLHPGELIGLIGPNGAGKSTLINAIAGIETYTGELLLNERHIDTYTYLERAQRIGLLPQLPECAWSLSVTDVVSLGRIPWGDEDSEMIQQAIKWAEIEHLALRQINELSGGERARVWFARVLAGQPRVLLADEPVASLDIHYQLSMLELLKRYAQEGNVVVVAIHDLSLAARYCDRLCLMDHGNIIENGTPEQVLRPEIISAVFNVKVEINLHGTTPYVLPG